MASFVIEGGHKLHGEIHPQGAKNEVLQILCATLLTSEEVTVTNIPDILDVNNLIQLLRDMGVKVSKTGIDSYTFKADTVDLNYLESDEFLKKCSSLRGSVMLVGPLVARFGKALISKPGGDKISAGVWTLTLSVFRNWEPVLIMMRNEVFSVFAQSIWKVLICCWMKLRLPVRLIL